MADIENINSDLTSLSEDEIELKSWEIDKEGGVIIDRNEGNALGKRRQNHSTRIKNKKQQNIQKRRKQSPAVSDSEPSILSTNSTLDGTTQLNPLPSRILTPDEQRKREERRQRKAQSPEANIASLTREFGEIKNTNFEKEKITEEALDTTDIFDELPVVQTPPQQASQQSAQNLASDLNKKGKIIEEALDTTDIFDELPVVFIGMYSFTNEELIEKFGDKTKNPEQVISLLKRVFQKKYPITRSNGLPKIPSRKVDKDLLQTLLQTYFKRLRVKILRDRKKHGNSMELRQMIDQLQQIKILQDHFEEDKETFPYHLFREFLDNQDSLDFKADLVQQIQKAKFKSQEDERVRSLLRQFAKLYLLQKGNDQFTVSDPGESKHRYQHQRPEDRRRSLEQRLGWSKRRE